MDIGRCCRMNVEISDKLYKQMIAGPVYHTSDGNPCPFYHKIAPGRL